MPDKPGKIGGKKVGGVKKTTDSESVEGADSVSHVGSVEKAGGVSGVGGVGGSRRRPTRTMTVAEREKLFGMISEEAAKLFKKSNLPPEQREIIENAVKMAVDSGLAEEEESEES